MLKNIPKIISPELLKILSEMGHGEELVIADGNFPAGSLNNQILRYDGISVPEILSAILELYPLDTYVDHSVYLQEVLEGDSYTPEIWNDFKDVLNASGEPYTIKHIDRFDFYERTKNAYAVIATSEEALYANIIIKKGVV